jgi:phosphoribosylamine--glycine ligase
MPWPGKFHKAPFVSCSALLQGNAGTAQCGNNLDIAVTDFESIKKACIENEIDLVLLVRKNHW